MDEMDSALKELTVDDLAERLARIRARLPGQTLPKRIEMARVRYGRLYTLAEIRAKVAGTLPRLLLAVRLGKILDPEAEAGRGGPDRRKKGPDSAMTAS